MTSWSVPRPHYELLCCAGDYGSAASNIEDIGSPGVSPLPAYYSAAEQSPITTSGTVQKGRPRKRKLSEVTGSDLPVTMRLAAGALGELCLTLLFQHFSHSHTLSLFIVNLLLQTEFIASLFDTCQLSTVIFIYYY